MAQVNLGGSGSDFASLLQSARQAGMAQMAGWDQLNKAFSNLSKSMQTNKMIAETEHQNLVENTKAAIEGSGVDAFSLAQTPEGQAMLRNYYRVVGIEPAVIDNMLRAIGGHWTSDRFLEAEVLHMVLNPEQYETNMNATLEAEAEEAAIAEFVESSGPTSAPADRAPTNSIGAGGDTEDGSGTTTVPGATTPGAVSSDKPKAGSTPEIQSSATPKLDPLSSATATSEDFIATGIHAPNLFPEPESTVTTENMRGVSTGPEVANESSNLVDDEPDPPTTSDRSETANPAQVGSGVLGESTEATAEPVVTERATQVLTYADNPDDLYPIRGVSRFPTSSVSKKELQFDVGAKTYDELTSLIASHPYLGQVGIGVDRTSLGSGQREGFTAMKFIDLIMNNFKKAHPGAQADDELLQQFSDLGAAFVTNLLVADEILSADGRQMLTQTETHSMLFQIEKRLGAQFPQAMEYLTTIDPSIALDRVNEEDFTPIPGVDYVEGRESEVFDVIEQLEKIWKDNRSNGEVDVNEAGGVSNLKRKDNIRSTFAVGKKLSSSQAYTTNMSPEDHLIGILHEVEAALPPEATTKDRFSLGGFLIQTLFGKSLQTRRNENNQSLFSRSERTGSNPVATATEAFISRMTTFIEKLGLTPGNAVRRELALNDEVEFITNETSLQVAASREARIASGIYSTNVVNAVKQEDGSIRYVESTDPVGHLKDSMLTRDQLIAREQQNLFYLTRQAEQDANELAKEIAQIEGLYQGYKDLTDANMDIIKAAFDTVSSQKDIDKLFESNLFKGAWELNMEIWGELLDIDEFKTETKGQQRKFLFVNLPLWKKRIEYYQLGSGRSFEELRSLQEGLDITSEGMASVLERHSNAFRE